MQPELAALAQFGVAGLIGWMWMVERRAAGARERQITELHERIVRERREADAILATLKENTRALAALEAAQRALLDALAGFLRRERPESGVSPGPRTRTIAPCDR